MDSNKWSKGAKEALGKDMETRLKKQFDFALVIQDVFNSMLQPIANKAVLSARSISRHASGPVHDVEDDELIQIFIDARNEALTKQVGISQEEAFKQGFHAVINALVPKEPLQAAPAPPAPPAAAAAPAAPPHLDFAINLNFI